MLKQIDVLSFVPHGDLTYPAFRDVEMALVSALNKLGHRPQFIRSIADVKNTTICLGANMLQIDDMESLGSELPLIIYQWEQAHPSVLWFHEHYVRLLKKFPVWDYSYLNSTNLKELFDVDVKSVVQFGYDDALITDKKASQKEYDVFFCGSLNKRRARLLDEFLSRGLKVLYKHRYDSQEERNFDASNSKICINAHFYPEASVYETLRTVPLICNGNFVISEKGKDTVGMESTPGVLFVPFADLPDAVCESINTESWKSAIDQFSGLRSKPFSLNVAQGIAAL